MTQLLDNFYNALQNNNHKVFDQLFMDYYVNLCRFAYTYLKDREASEEIVQEIFISLWEYRESININTSIRAYLYTSVKNRSLNYLRNEKTRIGHENEFASEQVSKVNELINFCEHEELHTLINDSINDLPKQCRNIFNLSRNEGLTYNDIAHQLNLSPKTVENQMGIALKKLRSKLAPYLTSIIAIF